MLNQYETVFITTPVLSDTQMKEAVGKFKDLLTSHGCELIHEESWGLEKIGLSHSKEIDRVLSTPRIQS